jgi:hypothetical protein
VPAIGPPTRSAPPPFFPRPLPRRRFCPDCSAPSSPFALSYRRQSPTWRSARSLRHRRRSGPSWDVGAHSSLPSATKVRPSHPCISDHAFPPRGGGASDVNDRPEPRAFPSGLPPTIPRDPIPAEPRSWAADSRPNPHPSPPPRLTPLLPRAILPPAIARAALFLPSLCGQALPWPLAPSARPSTSA